MNCTFERWKGGGGCRNEEDWRRGWQNDWLLSAWTSLRQNKANKRLIYLWICHMTLTFRRLTFVFTYWFLYFFLEAKAGWRASLLNLIFFQPRARHMTAYRILNALLHGSCLGNGFFFSKPSFKLINRNAICLWYFILHATCSAIFCFVSHLTENAKSL